MEKNTNYYKQRFLNLKAKKLLLRDTFEDVNRMVRNGGPLFDDTNDEGSFDKIHESTAPNSARKLVSVLMGLMWPSGKKAIKFRLSDKLKETTEHKEFSERVTRRQSALMDSIRSGFIQALEEYFFDLVTYGTAGIFISEDEDSIVKYKSWGIKHICIDEGENGVVDTVYYDDKWTAKRIVDTYGIEKVSKEIADCYGNKDKRSNKFQIVQAIEPHKTKAKDGTPIVEWTSVHFEVKTEHELKKGRFDDFPVPITRFYKDSDNQYGKSPAIINMPAIYELNRKVKHREMIEEQEIDPALGYDTNAFGGDTLDSTPGAMNPFDTSMAGAGTPIFRIIPQINVQITDDGIRRLEDKITEGFNLDRLLDFNSGQPLTATEAAIKNTIRGQSNNSIFARLTAEGFTLWIERTFNIALKAGIFGYQSGSPEHSIAVRENEEREASGLPPKEIDLIPDEIAALMASGEDFYTIDYNTPANSLRDSESLNSLVQGVRQVAELGQVMPAVMTVLDPVKIARQILKFNSIDTDVTRSDEEIEAIQQAQQQQAQLEQQQTNESNELTIQNQEAQLGETQGQTAI